MFTRLKYALFMMTEEFLLRILKGCRIDLRRFLSLPFIIDRSCAIIQDSYVLKGNLSSVHNKTQVFLADFNLVIRIIKLEISFSHKKMNSHLRPLNIRSVYFFNAISFHFVLSLASLNQICHN